MEGTLYRRVGAPLYLSLAISFSLDTAHNVGHATILALIAESSNCRIVGARRAPMAVRKANSALGREPRASSCRDALSRFVDSISTAVFRLLTES